MTEKAEKLAGKQRYDIHDLVEIMEILRSPGGCPWDAEQTHQSIRRDFIEEVYEVVEAIDTDDKTLMREELGDVLLQVVFHSRICEEDGEFGFDDVANDICAKLIERHPHVFGEIKVSGTADVLTNWDKIKEDTKHRDSTRQVLEGVTPALPALMRASKLAKKAAKAELYSYPDLEMGEEEIAQRLFDLSAYAQSKGLDAEKLLYDKNIKFIEEICSKSEENDK